VSFRTKSGDAEFEKADPSLTTPNLHPNDEDLSLGTRQKALGAPFSIGDNATAVLID
jgi:hypothetical protein